MHVLLTILAVLGACMLPVAAWIAYSALVIPRRLPLPPALPGERREFAAKAGRLSYYRDGPAGAAGPAAPLLLVHSVNAAASAYEVLPLYEHYRKSHTVYALDLPGYGFSERGDRAYSPRLMTDAVLAMVAEISAIHGTAPIHALALSLSSEFLARAAAENPGSFKTLAIVSPTGFNRRTPEDAAPGSTRAMPGLWRFFTFPLWSRAFFDLLTSRPSIRFFLQKTWGGTQIDEGLLEYDYLTTHQPGAQHAPYFFVSGFLFSLDIRRIYRALTQPVWMVHGARGDFVDYSGAAAFKQSPLWQVHELPTGALPHFELLEEFVRSYDAFRSRFGEEGAARPQ